MFSYGSLMGDNALRHYNGRPAGLAGYHRSFNHASTRRWGQPEQPCPVLGLSPGGECRGVAFEIPKGDEKVALRTLEHRLDRHEAGEEYARATQEIELEDGGPVQAWVWLSRPRYADGARWPEPAALEAALRAAHGVVGTGVEYVRTLIHAMDLWRIEDPMVRALWLKLKP
ncbi:MAG: gamma-glutamylcyclotransferase [Gemmatimonadales bacterium]